MTRPSIRAAAGATLGAVALVMGCTTVAGSASVLVGHAATASTPHLVTSGGNGINDVACVTTGACVAVGQYAVPHGFAAFVDVDRHSTWSVDAVPLPAFANTKAPGSELSGVACASSTSCIAVGSVTDTGGHEHALLESESAGAWRSITVPLPAGAKTTAPDDTLVAVSCSSSTSCAAVGSYERANGHLEPLVVEDTSGTWSAVATPLPTDANTTTPDDGLVDVACTVGGSCTAVGSYLANDGGEEALMVTGSAGSWADVTVPLPGNASTSTPKAELDTVSCTSATSCVAAGSYEDLGSNEDALLTAESSGVWSNVPVALPEDANTSPSLDVLNGASCSSAGNCVAVGVYETEDNYQEALIEVEAAGTWTVVSAALPPDANTVIPLDTLSAVSCSGDGDCVAVGFYSSNESYVYPKAFLEVEVAGTWVAGVVTSPPDSSTLRPYSNLGSISCVSILGCVAGGVYSSLAGNAQALLDNLGVAFANVPVVPQAPTSVTVKAGHGQATVSWRTPKSTGGSRITGYTVTASPGGRKCVTSGATSCTVRPLAATGYSFSVTASSALGSSAPSASSVPVLVEPPLSGAVVLASFAEGSSTLSAHLRSQIDALAARIVDGGNTSVALVGYNDDVGAASSGQALSVARAAAVRAALLDQLVARRAAYVTVTARGAGDADPVGPNGTVAGRAANRRVGVTVR
jgi:hypothetical protein